MSNHHYAVIMAGGGGTRLWPVSRKESPKQLLPLLGQETLFQSTVKRLENLFPPERILVVTIEEQAKEMKLQAPEIPEENYLIEPAPRGTASVVGLAAMVLKKRNPNAVMAILPSDHFIRNVDLFHYLLKTAFEVAENKYLVTLGITPTSPSTAYGYIQQGKSVEGGYNYPVYNVKKFVEKPNEETAQKLLRSGDHSWNSGMFIWHVDTILSEIEKQMPELRNQLEAIGEAWGTSKQNEVLSNRWKDLKNETVDYGIMEKAERVAVLPAGGLGWSDVGMWSSLFEVLLPDMNGNIATNTNLHLAHETHNTLVYGGSERLIVTIGVDDMVIVDTGDALLICKTDQSQRVKEVVEHLKKHRQEKFL
ncbi:MAG TPA: mannose-1-phosphate guanylyltransferase [Anaerolineae bacterium]|nr:mannose-1-phosphate guanylyltransferase [Anaerolineae bacterium]HRJ76125.1 mannose-1-phosphate guanylyltransferase [Anaerolineales bacterium]